MYDVITKKPNTKNENRKSLAILLDLKKIFDTISPKIVSHSTKQIRIILEI